MSKYAWVMNNAQPGDILVGPSKRFFLFAAGGVLIDFLATAFYSVSTPESINELDVDEMWRPNSSETTENWPNVGDRENYEQDDEDDGCSLTDAVGDVEYETNWTLISAFETSQLEQMRSQIAKKKMEILELETKLSTITE